MTAVRPERGEPFDGAAPPTGDDEPPRFSRIYAGFSGPDAGRIGHEDVIASLWSSVSNQLLKLLLLALRRLRRTGVRRRF
jgi:hypothetical protein